MEQFIFERIKIRTNQSVDYGKELYKRFFIVSKMYSKYKQKVDNLLITNGYGNIIIR